MSIREEIVGATVNAVTFRIKPPGAAEMA